MSFRFDTADTTLRAGVRRIGVEQAVKAVAALGDGKMPQDKRVHEARKAIKKMRALLRLVRPGIKGFKPLNRELRDIGRSLSALRDADVTAALLDDLLGEAGLPQDHAAALRDALSEGSAPADAAATIAAAQVALGRIADRMAALKLKRGGFAAISGGLSRSWSEARDAMDVAQREPDAVHLHDWRKRVKDHWYHARMLRPIWPDAMAVHVEAANRLAETLGQHQDLSVLEGRLVALPDGVEDAAQVLSLAVSRREALLEAAWPLGFRLLSERGDALAARWQGWWKSAEPPLPMA